MAVRKGGAYEFYARKFWRHGPFRWRFDDQPWRRCGRDAALLDDVSLAKFVNANWVDLGAVKLAAGKHRVRIEVDGDATAVAFDCFLLIDGPFVPRGRLKPGEKYGVAPAGWFAFEPDADPFEATPSICAGSTSGRRATAASSRPRATSSSTRRPVSRSDSGGSTSIRTSWGRMARGSIASRAAWPRRA